MPYGKGTYGKKKDGPQKQQKSVVRRRSPWDLRPSRRSFHPHFVQQFFVKRKGQKMIDVLIGCVIGWFAHIAWTKWGHHLVDLNKNDGS